MLIFIVICVVLGAAFIGCLMNKVSEINANRYLAEKRRRK